jgi:hypothetical protein
MGQRVNTMNHDPLPGPPGDRLIWVDEQVAELSLLLPGRQAAVLEGLAYSRGLTMGQIVRLLIRDYLTLVGADLPRSVNSKGEGR